MQKIRTEDPLSKEIWAEVGNRILEWKSRMVRSQVTPSIDVRKMNTEIESFDIQGGVDPKNLFTFIIHALENYCVDNQNPNNFGIYAGSINEISVITEALIAAYNPKLTNHTQSLFASGLESHLIKIFGTKLGYKESEIAGCFINNEVEAIQTAVHVALSEKIPNLFSEGLVGSGKRPVIYVSRQAHPSIYKTVRMLGLGTDSVRVVPNDAEQFMDVAVLDRMIREDLKNDWLPFMVVGTGGSVAAGLVDPILEISAVTRHFNLWCHIALGYGGSALFLENLSVLLEGIEFSDSVSLDVSKLLSQPADSSIFISRHDESLDRTFQCDEAYIPVDWFVKTERDMFSSSPHWSRRFLGLKTFTALAGLGWEGHRLAHQNYCQAAEFLRNKLMERGWLIVNHSHLPVVCFTKTYFTIQDLNWICQFIIASGRSWITVTLVDEDTYCLRAAIFNMNTTELEILDLVEGLEEASGKLWLRQSRISES